MLPITQKFLSEAIDWGLSQGSMMTYAPRATLYRIYQSALKILSSLYTPIPTRYFNRILSQKNKPSITFPNPKNIETRSFHLQPVEPHKKQKDQGTQTIDVLTPTRSTPTSISSTWVQDFINPTFPSPTRRERDSSGSRYQSQQGVLLFPPGSLLAMVVTPPRTREGVSDVATTPRQQSVLGGSSDELPFLVTPPRVRRYPTHDQ